MAKFKFYFSTSFNFDAIDGFHLLQDHVGTKFGAPWNDYDYIVTFQVYRVHQGKRNSFGHTKVLVKNLLDTSTYFRSEGTPVGDSIEITSLLKAEKIVSLASDIDYYQRLCGELGRRATDFLSGICDASYNYDRHGDFTQWPGFSSSLFRNSVGKAILKKGHQIARGRYTPEMQFELELKGLSDEFESVKFFFDNSRALGNTNINLLIGKNGSGKSHILRQVADQLTGILQNDESSPYFHKVIVAAYSPFETFKTENQVFEALKASFTTNAPEQPADQTKDLQEEMARRRLLVNEYAYIGFKDAGGQFSLDWPKESSAHALLKILAYDSENLWWGADSRFVLLYDTLKQSIDFDELAFTAADGSFVKFSIENDLGRRNFEERTKNVKHVYGIEFLKKAGNAESQPVSLSSGQTIYSYLLPSLVAEVDDESLLILDEPELYLHPAMEVGLINMLKKLLKATKSNSIIASHSSIMAREVERKGISILRREEMVTTVSLPTFETFGQSVELIMGEAFDDYRAKKAYEDSLDTALKKYNSPQEAMEKLAAKVGDEALAYLASKIDNDDEIVLVERPDNGTGAADTVPGSRE